MTIELSTLLNLDLLLNSLGIIGAIYVVRLVILRSFSANISPELWIAPRGLITILLFFAIPAELGIPGFDSGILLYVIIISSLIMSFALIFNARSKPAEVPPH